MKVASMKISRSKGFTLLEVVMACFLMGFISTFVQVAMRNSAYIDSAAKKISSDLMACRDSAVTTGKAIGLYKDSDRDYYVRYDTDVTNVVSDNVTGGLWQENMQRWKGVDVSGGFRIEFDSYGKTIVNTGNIVLTDGVNTRQISVNSQTGYVQIL